MAETKLPSPPSGYSSWAEYHEYIKEELKKFSSGHTHEELHAWGSPVKDKYNELKSAELNARYKAEEEAKQAKKLANAQKAAENGFGEREQKVASNMERKLATIEKWKAVAQKSIAKGLISENEYEMVCEWADRNVKCVDTALAELKKIPGEISSRDEKREISLASGTPVKSLNWGSFIDMDFKVASLWNIKPDIENAVNGYCESLDKRIEAINMDRRAALRTEKKDAKERQYNEIRKKFYVVKQGEIPTMKLFLDNYIERYVAHYTDETIKEGYRRAYENLEAQRKRMEKDYWSSSKEERKKYYDISERTTSAWREYYPFTRSREEIEKDAKLNADNLERNFILAVYGYSGEIESVELKWGKGGNLNGTATGKDGRKWKIETVLAGGYNIQCLHLRTLVHEIKK